MNSSLTVPKPVGISLRRWLLSSTLAVPCLYLACGPAVPDAASVGERAGEKATVTVTRFDPTAELSVAAPASSEIVASPPATRGKIRLSEPKPLLARGASPDGPLALPTVIAATRSVIFAFGRTSNAYVVRIVSTKTRPYTWSDPVVVASATENDAEPVATGDGEHALFAVSDRLGKATRVFRVEAGDLSKPNAKVVSLAPESGSGSPSGRLGHVVALLALKPWIGVVGREGDNVTYARLARTGGFTDALARTLTRTTSTTKKSRSPRATIEEERLLLAFDADDIPGALESPGTTPAERLAPKPGIFLKRFEWNGAPASPTRRLTRPGFEAHTLDVVVELGACAVLASTPDGFEMFRFVRKGEDMGPYGGGLHLAPSTDADVSLSIDVFGTLAVTPQKLLRIGPGVKIVPSPLGFSAPASGRFDHVRVASEGNYGAVALLSTTTSFGALPSFARVDGEKMGPPLPNPWVGSNSQRLLASGADGNIGAALVVEGSKLAFVRFQGSASEAKTDGKVPGQAVILETSIVPFDPSAFDLLVWGDAPFPRFSRVESDWIVGLRDGRLVLLTGARAGTIIDPGMPKSRHGGQRVVLPSGGKKIGFHVLHVPDPERVEPLSLATIDINSATAATFADVEGSAHHFGTLGAAKTQAVSRSEGGLFLLANSGPKVSSVAQLYELFSIDGLGTLTPTPILDPAPIQEIAVVPTFEGPALIATLTGRGSAARWLDGGPWIESPAFTMFRRLGHGPTIRDDKLGVLWLNRSPTAAPELESVDAACGGRFVLNGQLALLCEEPTSPTALSTQVVARFAAPSS